MENNGGSNKAPNALAAWLKQPAVLTSAFRSARILTVLFAVIALVILILIILAAVSLSANGVRIPLLFLLDEMDDELEMVLLFTVLSILSGTLCGFVRRMQASRDRE